MYYVITKGEGGGQPNAYYCLQGGGGGGYEVVLTQSYFGKKCSIISFKARKSLAFYLFLSLLFLEIQSFFP